MGNGQAGMKNKAEDVEERQIEAEKENLQQKDPLAY